MPSQRSPSRMASIAACVERSRSVSSMRNSILPARPRAYSQLNKAVRAPPICRKPVGEGAKRVTTVDICGELEAQDWIERVALAEAGARAQRRAFLGRRGLL